jgi:hypothetical protein
MVEAIAVTASRLEKRLIFNIQPSTFSEAARSMLSGER